MRRITLLFFICIWFFLFTSPVWAANTSEKSADEHYLMGNAYYSFGLSDNATREYRIAVEMNPDLSDAWNNLGLSLTAQKKYAEAQQALEQATRLNPSDADGWYNLGYTFGMQGNDSQELAAYEKAISLRPNMTVAWRNIGVVRYEKNDYTGAVKAFENATSFDPESGIGWYYLGTAYEKTGNLSGAAAVLKQAIKLDQNLTMAKDRLEAVEKNLTNITSSSQSTPKGTKTPLQGVTIVLSLLIASGIIILKR